MAWLDKVHDPVDRLGDTESRYFAETVYFVVEKSCHLLGDVVASDDLSMEILYRALINLMKKFDCSFPLPMDRDSKPFTIPIKNEQDKYIMSIIMKSGYYLKWHQHHSDDPNLMVAGWRKQILEMVSTYSFPERVY